MHSVKKTRNGNTKSRIRNKILSLLMFGVIILSVCTLLDESKGVNRLNDQLDTNEESGEKQGSFLETNFEAGIGSPLSSWYNNSANPIVINATATGVDANNWTWARTQEWCREGDGTVGNPYLIANITIDCGGFGNGIVILNSLNVHFTLQNCTVTKSGSGGDYGGIKLENTSNGTIIGNNCSKNGGSGIYLKSNCDSNILSYNTANSNVFHGIYGYEECDSNTFSHNDVKDNVYSGIYLRLECDSNILSFNTADSNADYGFVMFDKCDFNILSDNMAYNNTDHGFYFNKYCTSNIFSHNSANSNHKGGFYLNDYCDSNILSDNIATDNDQSGFVLSIYCDSNTLSDNMACNNSANGFQLNFYSNSNFFSDNMAYNNSAYGFYLIYNCDFNTLSNNCANDNDQSGFYFDDDCSLNILSDNAANHNGQSGFHLSFYCDSNTFSNNTANNNHENGFYIEDNCDSNILSDNVVNANAQFGLYLNSECDSNIFHTNSFYDNDYGIGIDSSCFVNHIFFNRLANRIYNAIDNNGSNYWNNGSIGNFWSNYVGDDNDRNGIGDTPHEIGFKSGIYDMFPIICLGNFITLKPAEKTLEIGALRAEIVWPLTDFVLDAISYEIFKDGVLIADGSINRSTSEIKMNITGLEEGEFYYKLSIEWPFHVTDIVKVVVSNSIPIIEFPGEDIVYDTSTSNNQITWSFTDVSVNSPTYTVYRNGQSIMVDVACNAGEQIVIPINGLEGGEYIYVIELNDGYGSICTKLVIITVPTQKETLDIFPYLFASILGAVIFVSIMIHGLIVRNKARTIHPKDMVSTSKDIVSHSNDAETATSVKTDSDLKGEKISEKQNLPSKKDVKTIPKEKSRNQKSNKKKGSGANQK
ncbi:nitrous oxide reductase family maturation protein NosD [Candidatus Lokiarchaeum ossiferum]|uniref:nitrous oxide reductase family maturation protein NosD n=1 Tax=Candidatus Lokiarchaeum ossiferum TaxID=2951803 RepID=UPI00352C715D